ncbi:Kinesin motor domain-containing protein [Trichostrongylus colubriformis]|uniref:Kinesin motor domain-containing protein n=1 Tax=Trichostrongylus colubriformis TaxID=6319 RepID=A0AAN8F128_TRICO
MVGYVMTIRWCSLWLPSGGSFSFTVHVSGTSEQRSLGVHPCKMPGAEFIRVTARVRPSATPGEERVVNVIDHKNLCFNSRNPRNFAFDSVFNEDVTQEEVFEKVASRIIDGCVNGFNGTIFAYGQTGSGKTHTMLGPSQHDDFLLNPEHRGLIPRVCDALFTKLYTKAAEKGENFKYDVVCRFVELYNEEFYDLLNNSQQKLTIRSDSNVVQLLGVSEHSVQSSTDLMRILEVGWESRRTAETAMNRESSRSHAIFIIDVKTEELINTIVNKKCATLNLVDLAGSERQSQAKTVGERFKEAININLSLSVLGRVIRTLSAASRRDEFIPYRESKLTHILRDSLGGNSKTAVIVNLHPDMPYYSDTLSTLKFAAACRKIENRVHANEDLSGDTIMAYKSEIARLRAELESKEEKVRSEMAMKVAEIEKELKLWKDTAISREKQLVEARLQRDLITAQLTCRPSGGGDMKEETAREVVSQLWERIDSIKTFEELSVAQLQNDLSSAQRELDQMRLRFESAEDARKALNEKYNSVLEGYDENLGSPLRRLNLNTSRRTTMGCKTPAQLKKERRMTMFTPPRDQPSRKSRAFKPVLFDDSVDGDALEQGNIEQDDDMVEERELLRLEMDNNRLSQIIREKEAKINEIYESQKIQAKQWIEEREQFLETEASLESQIDHVEMEKAQLASNLLEAQQRIDLLSAKIFSFNDERCRLQQEIDELRAEKFELEDRLQEIQNELEQSSINLKGNGVKLSVADLEAQLCDEQIKYNSLKELLDIKMNETKQAESSLQQKILEHEAVVLENDKLKRDLERMKDECARREQAILEEMEQIKMRIAEESKSAGRTLDQERYAHQKTKDILQSKTSEANQLSVSLHQAREELSDVIHQCEELKMNFAQLQERNSKMEREFVDEINKLKRRHADELNNAQNSVELERSAHENTKKQFSDYRDAMQETLDKKLAELLEAFTDKERRLTAHTSEKEQQLVLLQGENESLLKRCSRLDETEKRLEERVKELEEAKRELEVLRSAKVEGDRAITELAGHHNQKQKINYLEKVRLENYNLKNHNLELTTELERYQTLYGKLKKGAKEPTAGPSTRSRSARGIHG